MDKCPHCDSTMGFEYNATLFTSRIGEWGENVDEEVRVEYSVFPKTVKCANCGKRVNFDLAHGKAVEHSVHPTGLNVRQKDEVRKIVQSALDTGSA